MALVTESTRKSLSARNPTKGGHNCYVLACRAAVAWGNLPPVMILRRLGTSPSQRASAECVACNNCPDLFELADGDFAIIGFDVTDEVVPHLPSDAGCGAGERIVRIPRAVLVAAWESIPELC